MIPILLPFLHPAASLIGDMKGKLELSYKIVRLLARRKNAFSLQKLQPSGDNVTCDGEDKNNNRQQWSQQS